MNQGEAWSEDEILKRRAEIERPASSGRWSRASASARRSRRAPAASGGRSTTTSSRSATPPAPASRCSATISWRSPTGRRTDLDWRLPNGGTALRFDAVDFAAYDLFILERAGRRGGLFARADRRREGAVRGDDARGQGVARAQPDRLAARPRFRLRPGELPARARALRRHRGRGDARQPDRLRARDHRGGGRGGRAPRHPSGRSGLPDLRPAARAVDRRGRAQAVRRRAVASLRPHALRRLVRLEPDERSRRHGARIRAARPFRPSAQRQARAGRLVLSRPTTSAATSTWSRWSPN